MIKLFYWSVVHPAHIFKITRLRKLLKTSTQSHWANYVVHAAVLEISVAIGSWSNSARLSATIRGLVDLDAASAGIHRTDSVVERVQIPARSGQLSIDVPPFEARMLEIGDLGALHNTEHDGEEKNDCERSVHVRFCKYSFQLIVRSRMTLLGLLKATEHRLINRKYLYDFRSTLDAFHVFPLFHRENVRWLLWIIKFAYKYYKLLYL